MYLSEMKTFSNHIWFMKIYESAIKPWLLAPMFWGQFWARKIPEVPTFFCLLSRLVLSISPTALGGFCEEEMDFFFSK